MRVLVLGGAGFIGSHIVQRLIQAGHAVTTFLRPNHARKDIPAIYGDRNHIDQSLDDFRRLRPDIVVDTIAFTEAQAQALVTVFRGIARRTVVLSGGDVYRAHDILHGRVPGPLEHTPLTESSPLRDRLYPYRGVPLPHIEGFNLDDYEKIMVERAVMGIADLPGTVLRLPMVYGPGDHEGRKRRFWPYLKRMDDGREALLLDRRTANWKAPWGYTAEIAEAVRLAVEQDRAAGQIYNVGESDSLDMQTWIRELAQVAGWQGRVVVVDRPCPPPSLPRTLNLDQNLDMDTTKIRRELGYPETVSRREALAVTVAWDRAHPPPVDAG
jgi:nucleoside-diphosphate-sugar epimerase